MSIAANVFCLSGIVLTNFLGDVCISHIAHENTKAFLITSLALKSIACLSLIITTAYIPHSATNSIFDSTMATWVRAHETLLWSALLASTLTTIFYAILKEIGSAVGASTVSGRPLPIGQVINNRFFIF